MINVISDGFARQPYRERDATWIPVQLWGPVEKRIGLWTICLHAQTASESSIGELETFLERFAGQFTCGGASAGGVADRESVRWRDRLLHTEALGKDLAAAKATASLMGPTGLG